MSIIDALLEERRGYEVRGLKDRVAQVDEQLKGYGVAVTDEPLVETADAPPAAEHAVAPAKRKRA